MRDLEHISGCWWKLEKYLIEKNINIASRIVRPPTLS